MSLSMDRWKNKLAVVTSIHFGADLIQRLLDEDFRVVAFDYDTNRIQEAKTMLKKVEKFHPLHCDLTQENDILNAFKWIKENFGAISLLVNNATVFLKSSLHDGNTEDWRRVLDINVLGLSIATREAIRNMQEFSIDGDIVHVNSICGRFIMNIPNHIYYASKHAVTVMTEVLRKELAQLGSKIRITVSVFIV